MKKFIFATAIILFLPHAVYQILIVAFDMYRVIDFNVIGYTIATIISIQFFWGIIMMCLFFIAWVSEEKEKDEKEEKRKEEEERERQSRSK